MILPTKHITPERALLTIGAEILTCLREPMTVSRVWDELRKRRGETPKSSVITYDWFILALDLLFIVRAVDFNSGLLQKTAS